MSKPPASILSGNRLHRVGNGFPQRLLSSRFSPPQGRFQFGKRPLNWGEIRRIGWQEQKRAAFGFNGLARPRALMDTRIVHHDDLSFLQAGGKHLLDGAFKGDGVSRPFQHEGFSHPRKREGGNHRGILPVVARHCANGPLAFRGSGVQGSQRDRGPAFVNHDELLAIELAGLLSPGSPRLFVALGGHHRLFFRVQPSCLIARPIVLALTSCPCSVFHIWQCSSSVADGLASNWGSRSAHTASRFFAGLPGMAFGARSPSSFRCLRYRLMVERDTPSISLISSRDFSSSTARTTRSLRSVKYAFMNPAYYRVLYFGLSL